MVSALSTEGMRMVSARFKVGDRVTVRVFVRDVAERAGLNMSQLQRRAQLPMSTMQRYWHGVGAEGQPLTSIDLRHIDTLCEVLGVEVGDLLRRVPSEHQP
jgi:DNA-binding Xre family transcriptional regulator